MLWSRFYTVEVSLMFISYERGLMCSSMVFLGGCSKLKKNLNDDAQTFANSNVGHLHWVYFLNESARCLIWADRSLICLWDIVCVRMLEINQLFFLHQMHCRSVISSPSLVSWQSFENLFCENSYATYAWQLPYPEPVYTGWSSVHWNATGWPSVRWDTTGPPSEYLVGTLEHHWKNLVESAPQWNATGETLTFAAYTGTPLGGLWQPTHTPTHIVKHAE